jgi:hypothetical protein
MKGLHPFVVFFGILILFPVLFGLAYLLWTVNPLLALTALFLGIAVDVLGGCQLLSRALNHA